MASPFFTPGAAASPDTLALIHLKRDLIVPTVLQDDAGNIANTRFGSFPHSTLLGLPWGSQVLASKVDTGSRGRKKDSKKRKREEDTEDTATGNEKQVKVNDRAAQEIQAASSGFAHLLPPTPELWTISLPHRTQVVYTPDYSYILQRLRVRPGDTIIEAGAGSGSFTHAAARAVFNGYADTQDEEAQNDATSGKRKKRKHGKVYSFEFHEPRAKQLQEEIKEHGLDGIVTITHRDVYQDGFCLPSGSTNEAEQAISPQADAIFLDLPAPWLALKHLTRSPLSSPPTTTATANGSSPSPRKTINNDPSIVSDLSTSIRKKLLESGWHTTPSDVLTRFIQYLTFILANWTRDEVTTSLTTHHPSHLPPLPPSFPSWLYTTLSTLESRANPPSPSPPNPLLTASPLNLKSTIRLCTFSPCIEQVTSTVSQLRQLGWVDISMVEVSQRRLDVRRERVGYGEEGLRGVNASAASVEEALERLREVEGRFRRWDPRGVKSREEGQGEGTTTSENGGKHEKQRGERGKRETAKERRLEEIRERAKERKVWKEGRVVHRTETEIKTHTSYLVFAVLPRVWSERDEERARGKWGAGKGGAEAAVGGSGDVASGEGASEEV